MCSGFVFKKNLDILGRESSLVKEVLSLRKKFVSEYIQLYKKLNARDFDKSKKNQAYESFESMFKERIKKLSEDVRESINVQKASNYKKKPAQDRDMDIKEKKPRHNIEDMSLGLPNFMESILIMNKILH